MMRGGIGNAMGGGGGGGRNIFQVGKSKPTVITKEMKTGVNFNDGMGGGDVLKSNIIFNMVRETQDQ